MSPEHDFIFGNQDKTAGLDAEIGSLKSVRPAIIRDVYAGHGKRLSRRGAREIAVDLAERREKDYEPFLIYFDHLLASLKLTEKRESVSHLGSPMGVMSGPDVTPLVVIKGLDDWEQFSLLLGLSPTKQPPSSRIKQLDPKIRAQRICNHFDYLLQNGADRVDLAKIIVALSRLATLDPRYLTMLHWYPEEKTNALDELSEVITNTYLEWQNNDDPIRLALMEADNILGQLSQRRWIAARYDFPGKPENFMPALLFLAERALKMGLPPDEVGQQLLMAIIARRTALTSSTFLEINELVKKFFFDESPEIWQAFLRSAQKFQAVNLSETDCRQLGLTNSDSQKAQAKTAFRPETFNFRDAEIVFVATGGFNPFHNRQLLSIVNGLKISEAIFGDGARVVVQPWRKRSRDERGLASDQARLLVCQKQLMGFSGSRLIATLAGQPETASPTSTKELTSEKFLSDIPSWLAKNRATQSITLGRICGLEKIDAAYPSSLRGLHHILMLNAEDFRDLDFLDTRVKEAFDLLAHPPIIVILPCGEYRATDLRRFIEEARNGSAEARENVHAMLMEPAAEIVLETFLR